MRSLHHLVRIAMRFRRLVVLALLICVSSRPVNAAPGDTLHTFTPPPGQVAYRFGHAFGRLDGDIFVGGQNPDVSFVANVYDGKSYQFERSFSISAASGATISDFIWSTAVHNGQLLVGGVWTRAISGFGVVHLVDGATGNGVRTFRNTTVPPNSNDAFGLSVAFSGNDVLVTDYLAPGGSPTGAVYLYDGGTGSLLRTFLNPTGRLNDDFGGTLAASGDSILIGAPRYRGPDGRESGAVYLFDRESGALVNTVYGAGTSAIERFGQSMAVDGSRVLIGGQQTGPHAVYDARNLSLIQHIPDSRPYRPDYYTAGAFVDHAVALTRFAGDPDLRHVVKLFDGNSGELIADLYSPGPSSIAYFGPAAAAGNDVLVRYRTQDSVLLYEGAHAPGPSMLTMWWAVRIRLSRERLALSARQYSCEMRYAVSANLARGPFSPDASDSAGSA